MSWSNPEGDPVAALGQLAEEIRQLRADVERRLGAMERSVSALGEAERARRAGLAEAQARQASAAAAAAVVEPPPASSEPQATIAPPASSEPAPVEAFLAEDARVAAAPVIVESSVSEEPAVVAHPPAIAEPEPEPAPAPVTSVPAATAYVDSSTAVVVPADMTEPQGPAVESPAGEMSIDEILRLEFAPYVQQPMTTPTAGADSSGEGTDEDRAAQVNDTSGSDTDDFFARPN